MGDMYDEWTEAFEAGETTEDFEDWYSGKCADAYDRAKDAMKERGVP